MLFNSRKIMIEKNELAKHKILGMIEGLISKSIKLHNDKLSKTLSSIRSELNSLSPTASGKLLEIYYKTIRYLADLQKDLDQGFLSVADLRIEHVNSELSGIKNICDTAQSAFATKRTSKIDKQLEKEFKKLDEKYLKTSADESINGINIEELYSDDDLFSIIIWQKQDEINKFDEKLQKLRERRGDELKNKEALLSEISEVEDLKKTAKTILEKFAAVRKKGSVATFMKSVGEATKKAMSMAGISDNDLQVLFDSYQNEMDDFQKSEDITNDIRSKVMGDSSGMKSGTAFNSNPMGGKSSNFVNSSNVGNARNVAPATMQVYSEDALLEMRDEVRINLKFYQKQRDKFQEKYDAANADLIAAKEQLLPLVVRLGELSAGNKMNPVYRSNEQGRLTQKVNILFKRAKSLERYANAYQQQINNYINKESLCEDADLVIELQLNDLSAQDIGGKFFSDLESVALWLKNDVANRNAEAEHINDLLNVARGEDYDTSNLDTDVSTLFNDSVDGDKLQEIKKFLGLE